MLLRKNDENESPVGEFCSGCDNCFAADGAKLSVNGLYSIVEVDWSRSNVRTLQDVQKNHREKTREGRQRKLLIKRASTRQHVKMLKRVGAIQNMWNKRLM